MTAPHSSTVAEECIALLRSMHNQNWNGPINGLLLENICNLLQISFRKYVSNTHGDIFPLSIILLVDRPI